MHQVELHVLDPELPIGGSNVLLVIDGMPMKLVQDFSIELSAGSDIPLLQFSMLADVRVVYRDKEKKDE